MEASPLTCGTARTCPPGTSSSSGRRARSSGWPGSRASPSAQVGRGQRAGGARQPGCCGGRGAGLMSPPACFPGALQPLTSENLQAVSSSPASPTALYYSIEQAPRLGRLRTARGDEVRNFTQAQVRSRPLHETLCQPHSSGVPPHLLGGKLLAERCLLGGAKPSPHGARAGSRMAPAVTVAPRQPERRWVMASWHHPLGLCCHEAEMSELSPLLGGWRGDLLPARDAPGALLARPGRHPLPRGGSDLHL